MSERSKKALRVSSIIILILAVIFLLGIFIAKDKEKEVQRDNSIIPVPEVYNRTEGKFVIMQDTKIILDSNSQNIKEIESSAKGLKDKIDIPTGYNLDIEKSDKIKENSIFIKLDNTSSAKSKDGYKISITEKNIVIESSDIEGINRGIEVLIQILPDEIISDELVWDVVWDVDCAIIEYNIG